MSKPMVRVHDTETNEIIDREMTDAEFKQYKADQAELAAFRAEIAAQNEAKQILLDRLGISEAEAKLLLG